MPPERYGATRVSVRKAGSQNEVGPTPIGPGEAELPFLGLGEAEPASLGSGETEPRAPWVGQVGAHETPLWDRRRSYHLTFYHELDQ